MSFFVFCRDIAPDYTSDWNGERVGLVYKVAWGVDELQARMVDFEPEMVLFLDTPRSYRMDGFTMAHWIATNYRGAIFDGKIGEYDDLVEQEPESLVESPASLAELLERWDQRIAPAIEREREAAQARRRALDEELARVRTGEQVEFFDWSMDETDEEAAARVNEQIEARRRQAATRFPIDDPEDIQQLLRLLTANALRALVDARRLARRAGSASVSVPHWLLTICDLDGSDVPVVLEAMHVDPDALRQQLTGLVANRQRHAFDPTLSDDIGALVRQAWDRTDQTQAESRIRTGHLLWAALGYGPQGQASEYWRHQLSDLVPTGGPFNVREALAANESPEAVQARIPISALDEDVQQELFAGAPGRPTPPDPEELRRLIPFMTPPLLRALETACQDAANSGHAVVDVAHWLLAILGRNSEDVRVVADIAGIDLVDLRDRLVDMLTTRPTGAGTPVFTSDLILLARQARQLAQRTLRGPTIRSGFVLCAAVSEPMAGTSKGWWRDELRATVTRSFRDDSVLSALTAAGDEKTVEDE